MGNKKYLDEKEVYNLLDKIKVNCIEYYKYEVLNFLYNRLNEYDRDLPKEEQIKVTESDIDDIVDRVMDNDELFQTLNDVIDDELNAYRSNEEVEDKEDVTFKGYSPEYLKRYNILEEGEAEYPIIFDEFQFRDFMRNFLDENYKMYLVVSFPKNNVGKVKYSFTDYINAFYREYNVKEYIRGGSIDNSNKVLLITESSNDTICAYDTIIIGLDDTEFEAIGNLNSDKVIEYAKNKYNDIYKF